MNKDQKLLLKTAQVTTNYLTWLGVHGNLCLALRHPMNKGPSRQWVFAFVQDLGKSLVKWGVLTEQELKKIEKTEIEEGSTDFMG